MTCLSRTLLAASCAAAIAGCAANPPAPVGRSENLPSQAARAAALLEQDWPIPAAVTNSGEPLVVLHTPATIPSSILAARTSVSFGANTTVAAIAAYLAELGHSVIVADEAAASKTFYMPNYKGTLGGLLAAVSRATDVWFTWQEGTILISSQERVMVTLPQEPLLAKTVKTGLSSLGDDSAAALWEAGVVSVSVKPSTYRRIRAYLERMSQNAAILSINAAVVTLDLNSEVKSGVDWESLSLTLGKGLDLPASGIGTGGQTPNNGGTNQSTGSTGQARPDLVLGGTGLNVSVARGSFKLNALVDFLSKYGRTETRQDLILKSVSGGKVEIKSLVQVPYVSGVTNNGVVSNSNTAANGTLSASVQTEKADDGIEMKVSPNYDASAGTVAMDIQLALKAVLGYNKLSAGNQVGELTQPTTAERKFESSIRMRPGETAVVGGVTYEQLVDRQGRPLFIPDSSQFARTDASLRKQSIFVVLRPTVTTFGPVKGAEALDWFIEGKLPGQKDPRSQAAPGTFGSSAARTDLPRPQSGVMKRDQPARQLPPAAPEGSMDAVVVRVLSGPDPKERTGADGVLESARAIARARIREKDEAHRAIQRARMAGIADRRPRD